MVMKFDDEQTFLVEVSNRSIRDRLSSFTFYFLGELQLTLPVKLGLTEFDMNWLTSHFYF